MATIYSGTDISRYQGVINWASYAAAKSFVIIKAGGGDAGLYTDGRFGINQAGARAQAGLRIGYYFFGDSNIDAATSANYFMNTVGTPNNGEIMVLDIENHSWGGTPSDSWAYVFCTAIYQRLGFHPFVYMSQFSPSSSSLNWPTTSPIAYFWMANYSLSSSNFSSTAGNADSAWGGIGAPNYRILQYSSSGSVAGIAGAVDLDSFYSPNNTLADWDALGYQGTTPTPPAPPAPGDLTVATVSNPVVVYNQPAQQTVNVPTESYDQVLFSTKFTTSVTSSSWPVRIAGPATGLNYYAYPVGNYTYNINSQSTLNDYGFINAGDYGQFPGTLPTVVVQPIVSSSGVLTFDVVVNNVSGSVTVNLVLNIALMAVPGTTTVPVTTTSQSIARSNAIPVAPSPYSTYRRIYQDTHAGTGATSILHNQGTIPNILYWVRDNSGDLEPQPVTWSSTGHTTAFGISMDTSTIYTYVDAANNARCDIRIYKDN